MNHDKIELAEAIQDFMIRYPGSGSEIRALTRMLEQVERDFYARPEIREMESRKVIEFPSPRSSGAI